MASAGLVLAMVAGGYAVEAPKAVSQSAGDWVEIKDPAELRALYSNTTFRGTGIYPSVSFVGHYSADGRGVSNFLGKTVPRTWVVKGDQVCVTDAARTDCWIYWRHRINKNEIKSMRIRDAWTWIGTVEDGIPKF